jgi:hypothetical protein
MIFIETLNFQLQLVSLLSGSRRIDLCLFKKQLNIKVMKTYTLIIGILFFLSGTALSQNITLANNVEVTNGGTQYGVSMGWSDKLNIEYGMFHSMSPKDSQNNGEVTQYHQGSTTEQSFSGVYLDYPIRIGQYFDMGLLVRTGLVNGQDFKITPALMSSLHLGKSLNLNVGVGFRGLSPTLNTGLKISF